MARDKNAAGVAAFALANKVVEASWVSVGYAQNKFFTVIEGYPWCLARDGINNNLDVLAASNAAIAETPAEAPAAFAGRPAAFTEAPVASAGVPAVPGAVV